MGGTIYLLLLNYFCKQHKINIHGINAYYTRGRGRYHRQNEESLQ